MAGKSPSTTAPETSTDEATSTDETETEFYKTYRPLVPGASVPLRRYANDAKGGFREEFSLAGGEGSIGGFQFDLSATHGCNLSLHFRIEGAGYNDYRYNLSAKDFIIAAFEQLEKDLAAKGK